MEVDDVLLILLIGGGILLGLFIGWILGFLLSPKGKSDRKSGPTSGEVLRIVRHPVSGKISLVMEGKPYQSPKELNVNRRYRLVMLLDEIRKWLGKSVSQTEDFDQRLRNISQVPIAESAKTYPVSQIPPVTQAPPTPTLGALEATPAKPKTSLNPLFILTQAITADIPKQVSQEKSIASQIDELLQDKLLDSPLKNRGIRLMELPGKGMVVMVGMDQYESVDDVPDEQVKALIKQCVSEWEASLYPE